MFADDAYNKFTKNGHGSLIGNWAEEASIRDATGEGRTVPMRHIPRSGLLKDFTKVPSCGPRKSDNTFERTYGPKRTGRHVPMSKTIGGGEEDLTGETKVPLLLQASGRIPKIGARELMASTARLELGEQEVQEEEAEIDRRANERLFHTTSAVNFSKPDETLIERPVHLRKSFKLELLHGPRPDGSRALRNAGLEVQTHVHYSNVEGPTHAHMSLMDPRLRNDMKVSACSGYSAFGKHADFSKPVNEYIRGLNKDDELEKLYNSTLKATNPMRQMGGSAPRAQAFEGVPSLTVLKETIHRALQEKLGVSGFVLLRQRMYDISDHEGFVRKPEIINLLRHELDLIPEELEGALEVYLNQQVTMKRDEFRVASVMTSLRPPMRQQLKLRVLAAFQELGPGSDGSIRLYSWLCKQRDQDLRSMLVTAFGGMPGDESSVADVPLTEAVFMELLSDLAPFADVDALLG